MSIDKLRLKMLATKWKPMGLEDKMLFGRYKNCRLTFIIQTNPWYLRELLKHDHIVINQEVRTKLNEKIQELGWNAYLLN